MGRESHILIIYKKGAGSVKKDQGVTFIVQLQ